MSKELESLKEKQYYDSKQDLWVVSVNHIQRVLTPPTADEVCKALSEYYKIEVEYSPLDHTFESAETWYAMYENDFMDLGGERMPPHLITMIGRFYNGIEEKK